MKVETHRVIEDCYLTNVRCMDCGKTSSGNMSLVFIDTPEGTGIEVGVRDAEMSGHAIARVRIKDIPWIDLTKEEINEVHSN
jgi:hypothetical protein